jgi:DNA-binding transcriptional LysR family regulator
MQYRSSRRILFATCANHIVKHRYMIDLNRLRGLHLVAESGGYASAARNAPYPITHAALHQQVKKLEDEVAMQLLERIGKDRMQPTPAGARLLAFVAPFLRDLETVLQSLRTGEFDGALTIHAESLLIRQLLPPWLLSLRRRRPRMQLHLVELLRVDVDLLRTGAADVLVAHLPEPPDDIATQHVADVYACLVVPRHHAPEHRATRRGRPNLRDLRALPFLAYPAGSRQHALQMQALALHDALPSQVLNLDTADAILGYVESGLGWSLVPSLERGGPRGRRLAAYAFGDPPESFPIVMAWRKDMPENPMLDTLIHTAPSPERPPARTRSRTPRRG